MNRTEETREHKARKSYTLSPESIAFLEALGKTRPNSSISSILDEILQNVRIEHERVDIERAVVDYYASLSDQEMKEQATWGELAERESLNVENI